MTTGWASPTTARLSRVRFARSSWMMPMIELKTMRMPNAPSIHCPVDQTSASSTDRMALTRVKTFARMMPSVERPERDGRVLTSPAAMRSATSAEVSPTGGAAASSGTPHAPFGQLRERDATLLGHLCGGQEVDGARHGGGDPGLDVAEGP